MKVDGRCHCGAITYEAEVDPARVTLCHCRDCQVLTGTAYRTTVPTAVGAFVLRTGSLRTYVKVAESGNKRIQAFCGDCGTPVYACAYDDPKTYGLRIGALAQRDLLPPRSQKWCRSALSWSASIADLPGRPTE